MQQEFEAANYLDDEGNPMGGHVESLGLSIGWQNGPLGRGEDRQEPNGAFVETVIAAAKQRLEFYQETKFNCQENADAISFLQDALNVLSERTARREAEDVEGTHEGN